MHPEVKHVLPYFQDDHLPDGLKNVARPFRHLALTLTRRSPQSPETAVALRKLLEAREAALRAATDAFMREAFPDLVEELEEPEEESGTPR